MKEDRAPVPPRPRSLARRLLPPSSDLPSVPLLCGMESTVWGAGVLLSLPPPPGLASPVVLIRFRFRHVSTGTRLPSFPSWRCFTLFPVCVCVLFSEAPFSDEEEEEEELDENGEPVMEMAEVDGHHWKAVDEESDGELATVVNLAALPFFRPSASGARCSVLCFSSRGGRRRWW